MTAASVSSSNGVMLSSRIGEATDGTALRLSLGVPYVQGCS